ncbi:MAG: carbohydrate-binding family 9-like protein [Chloracidobacterium sp.]|nr:carbohydrate-binding family 9-like protein [Chloracidobacterium sp.]
MKKVDEIIAVFRHSPRLTLDFHDEYWREARPLAIDCNWRGEEAPGELKTTAMVLWSEREIFFGFECAYAELDVDQEFDPREERYALWDRDVCEAFVRSPIEPHEKQYREFEVAPTGQWCDLIVDRSRMLADWRWRSGMRTASEIVEAEQIWRAAMAVPFEAFGCEPRAEDIWHANLFRVSRSGGERRYLALSPTFTETPNFHVAEAFMKLRFVA